MKQRREGSRAKQIERANRGLCKPDVFKPGDTVYFKDQEGKWKFLALIKNQRKHQGINTLSYLLRNSKSSSLTTRNKRDKKKFPGNKYHTADTADTLGNVNNVIMGIMKHNACMKTPESTERADLDADNTELSASGRRKESKDQSIREVPGSDTDSHPLHSAQFTKCHNGIS